MSRLKELYDERVKLHESNKKILDHSDDEKRELTAEESEQWDRQDAEVEKLCDIIERHEKQARRETFLNDSRGRATDPQPPLKQDSDADTKAGKPIELEVGGGRKLIVEAGTPLYERAQQEYGKIFGNYLHNGINAGLHTGDNTKGGYVTTTQFNAQILKKMDDLVFMRQISNVLPPLLRATSLGVPTLETDIGDAEWTPEVPASAMSEDTNMELGKRELTPHLLAKFIKVSMKLLRAGAIDVESFILGRLAYKFSISEEKAFLEGTADHEALGVFTASSDGISTSRDTTATSTTVFTADEMISTYYTLKSQYMMNATWILHRDAVARIRKFKSGEGQYLWQPGMTAGQPSTIFGRPYFMSEYAPNTFTTGLYVAIIGDFRAGYWIVDSLQMEVQRLNELLALTNQIGFIGRRETDGMPVLEEAFARLILN